MIALLKPILRQSFASSGIYLLIIALSLAISATTALKFSHDQIQQAISLQAAKLQAADLVLTDQTPIANSWNNQARKIGLALTEVTLFSSMAHTGQNFVMVNVKAIEENFPLRGELKVKPDQTTIQPGEVWLSQRAMDLLNVRLNEALNIADAQFKVTGIIEHDTNQEIGFSGFSPTVYISKSDIQKTNAIQVGSRVEYRLLLAGSKEQIQNYQAFFENKQNSSKSNDHATSDSNGTFEEQSGIKLRTANDANTRLMKPIQNLDTFLQLANILTILLCGIAIAMTSQRYVTQHQDHIALLRCVGAQKYQIVSTYLVLLFFVIAISIVVGSLLGLGLGFILLQFILQLIPQLQLTFNMVDLLFGPLPIAIFTSAIVLLGFVFPNLWRLVNTAPIRVIRRSSITSNNHWLGWLIGLSSLVVFSIVLTGNVILSFGAILITMVLAATFYGIVLFTLTRIKGLKNKFSNYVREPNQSALQITALALGLSFMTVLSVLRVDLLDRWQTQLPEGTPNQFVYGLPPFETESFKQQIIQNKWKGTPLYPNVRARLIEKNGKPFGNDVVEKNNALQRELNLTESDQYPQNNKIVEGSTNLMQAGDVSVEVKLAEDLGIQVGDRLTFRLPEGDLKAKVVNLRTVEWESFSPNFFFIFAPQSMDANAGSYLGSFFVPDADRPKLVQLIQQFSNTVFIDVSLILNEIKSLVNVLVKIMGLLALLVGLSGILVLIACLNLLLDERKREVALLRSFGISKAKLKSMLTLEVGFLGFIAGLVACFFAEVISALVSYQMGMTMQLHLKIWLILPTCMFLLCAIIGRYRLSYLTEISPLKSLRELN